MESHHTVFTVKKQQTSCITYMCELLSKYYKKPQIKKNTYNSCSHVELFPSKNKYLSLFIFYPTNSGGEKLLKLFTWIFVTILQYKTTRK